MESSFVAIIVDTRVECRTDYGDGMLLVQARRLAAQRRFLANLRANLSRLPDLIDDNTAVLTCSISDTNGAEFYLPSLYRITRNILTESEGEMPAAAAKRLALTKRAEACIRFSKEIDEGYGIPVPVLQPSPSESLKDHMPLMTALGWVAKRWKESMCLRRADPSRSDCALFVYSLDCPPPNREISSCLTAMRSEGFDGHISWDVIITEHSEWNGSLQDRTGLIASETDNPAWIRSFSELAVSLSLEAQVGTRLASEVPLLPLRWRAVTQRSRKRSANIRIVISGATGGRSSHSKIHKSIFNEPCTDCPPPSFPNDITTGLTIDARAVRPIIPLHGNSALAPLFQFRFRSAEGRVVSIGPQIRGGRCELTSHQVVGLDCFDFTCLAGSPLTIYCEREAFGEDVNETEEEGNASNIQSCANRNEADRPEDADQEGRGVYKEEPISEFDVAQEENEGSAESDDAMAQFHPASSPSSLRSYSPPVSTKIRTMYASPPSPSSSSSSTLTSPPEHPSPLLLARDLNGEREDKDTSDAHFDDEVDPDWMSSERCFNRNISGVRVDNQNLGANRPSNTLLLTALCEVLRASNSGIVLVCKSAALERGSMKSTGSCIRDGQSLIGTETEMGNSNDRTGENDNTNQDVMDNDRGQCPLTSSRQRSYWLLVDGSSRNRTQPLHRNAPLKENKTATDGNRQHRRQDIEIREEGRGVEKHGTNHDTNDDSDRREKSITSDATASSYPNHHPYWSPPPSTTAPSIPTSDVPNVHLLTPCEAHKGHRPINDGLPNGFGESGAIDERPVATGRCSAILFPLATRDHYVHASCRQEDEEEEEGYRTEENRQTQHPNSKDDIYKPDNSHPFTTAKMGSNTVCGSSSITGSHMDLAYSHVARTVAAIDHGDNHFNPLGVTAGALRLSYHQNSARNHGQMPLRGVVPSISSLALHPPFATYSSFTSLSSSPASCMSSSSSSSALMPFSSRAMIWGYTSNLEHPVDGGDKSNEYTSEEGRQKHVEGTACRARKMVAVGAVIGNKKKRRTRGKTAKGGKTKDKTRKNRKGKAPTKGRKRVLNPRTAYQFFLHSRRGQGLRAGDMSREWAGLDGKMREIFTEQARKDKHRYAKELVQVAEKEKTPSLKKSSPLC